MNSKNDDPRAVAVEADRVEARAWTDWFAAIPPEFRSEFGFGVRTVADATLLMAPQIPLTLFNRTVGLGMTLPATADDLDAAVKVFVDAGCSPFALAWGPYSEPAALAPHLDAMFPTPAQRPSWAKMVRGTVPPSAPASDLRIVPVDRSLVGQTDRAIACAQGAPFLAGILAPLFWRPRWHLYAAMDGDVVVGGAALFLDGDSAWLGMAGVLPEYRRRGGQSSLMVQRIRDAITAGAKRIFTETDEPSQAGANPSLNNMERCGFEKILSRTHFIGPKSA
ncbi:MAG TPA: GNAT family N-acetyltransferase [Blastocatellia bacterium]|nr:GNAT family N-acetyltransferase [Blastocatellia bacterium]